MGENVDQLREALTAHVVPGTITAADLMREIEASPSGFCDLTAVSGDALSAKIENDAIHVFDESGGVARVATADVMQSNGVIHIVEAVLVPE